MAAAHILLPQSRGVQTKVRLPPVMPVQEELLVWQILSWFQPVAIWVR